MADDPGSGPRRTWPERLAIVATFASAVVCFLVAAALIAGYVVVRQRNIVDLQDPAGVAAAAGANAAGPVVPETVRPATTGSSTTADVTLETGAATTPATGEVDDSRAPTTTAGPVATFPDADPEAQNFLITGADNGACIDPDSPYAGAFGDREGMGERSDTIMVLRVDPDADRVALLSFPRDLYVDIGGSKSRINSAYRRDDPQRLIDTIFENFGVPIDHYLQVDFCAFKTLVDAVGGVAVPFEFPARDENTGLNVPTTGCFVFDGEHALAYVQVAALRLRGPTRKRQLAGGSGQRSRSCLTSAGLHPPHPLQHSRRRAPQSPCRPRPDPRRNGVRGHRPRPHGGAHARVRRGDERRRSGLDPHLPDRSDGADHQRGVGPRSQHGWREHAGDPRHVPRRNVTGRCPDASVR